MSVNAALVRLIPSAQLGRAIAINSLVVATASAPKGCLISPSFCAGVEFRERGGKSDDIPLRAVGKTGVLKTLGVRGRLFLAFFGISGLAVLGAVAALFASPTSGRSSIASPGNGCRRAGVGFELSRQIERVALPAPSSWPARRKADREKGARGKSAPTWANGMGCSPTSGAGAPIRASSPASTAQ